jgi:hypothetical protein
LQAGFQLEAQPFYAWTTSLCRLILRIQNYRHGGALLITPDLTSLGLKIRHELPYSRLRTAIEDKVFFEEASYKARDATYELWRRHRPVPADLYLDEALYADELEDARSELNGAIWFVSLLSRVDGLILMTPEFDVVGFGVEINVPDIPSRIFMAHANLRARGVFVRSISKGSVHGIGR